MTTDTQFIVAAIAVVVFRVCTRGRFPMRIPSSYARLSRQRIQTSFIYLYADRDSLTLLDYYILRAMFFLVLLFFFAPGTRANGAKLSAFGETLQCACKLSWRLQQQIDSIIAIVVAVAYIIIIAVVANRARLCC